MPVAERELASSIGVNRSLVGRKRRQGKTDDQIAEDAENRRAKPHPNSDEKDETYYAAQARKESALADLRELELAEKRAELVSIHEVGRIWGGLITAAKTRLIGIGSKLGPILAIETDAAACQSLIDAAVREAMGEIAEYRPDA
jgi:hypothetical protein